MMNEAEAEAAWYSSTDPRPMCGLLNGKERGRKFRLFVCACCRRIAHLLRDERSHEALEVFERFLDGELTLKEFSLGERAAAEASASLARVVGGNDSRRGSSEADQVRLFSFMLAAQAVTACFGNFTSVPADCCGAMRGYGTAELVDDVQLREVGEQIEAAERSAQAALLRDVFGNPFHSHSFHPSWRTPAAVSLARKMYASHDFDDAPELADLLEDAGCDNERILNHCRYSSRLPVAANDAKRAGAITHSSPHVRGCWVVDLVVSKE